MTLRPLSELGARSTGSERTGPLGARYSAAVSRFHARRAESTHRTTAREILAEARQIRFSHHVGLDRGRTRFALARSLLSLFVAPTTIPFSRLRAG